MPSDGRKFRQINETEIEKEFFLKRPLRGTSVSIIRILLETLVLTIIALFPALITRQMPGYQEYGILDNRGYVGLNHIMEFWRYSIFIVAVCWAYVFALITIQCAPSIIVFIAENMKGKTSIYWRRQMYYIHNITYPLAGTIFVFLLVLISSNLLYHSSFLETITMVVSSRPPDELYAYLLERFYIFLIIFFSFYAFSRYLVEVITYNYHKTAFSQRIYDVEYKLGVLDRLYQALCRGFRRSRKKENYSHNQLYDTQLDLLKDDDMGLCSSKQAEKIALEVFTELCPANRDYIKIDDIRPYFDEVELARAFSVFDSVDYGRIGLEEFTEAILKIHEERFSLEESLRCNKRILKKLSKLFVIISLISAILVGVALFKLETTTVVIAFGVVYVGFNFAANQYLTEIYEAIIFIFVEHAFDVGDRVIIKDESLLVDQIDLYTTRFRKWDNTTVFIPNAVLAVSTIYNIRRSGNSSELFEVQLSTSLPIDRIWSFRDKIIDFVKTNPKDFTENLDIASIEVIDSTAMKITLIVEYMGNFQNLAMKTARRNLLNAEIKRVRDEMII